MSFEYKVVALTLEIVAKNATPSKAAEETQHLINLWVSKGWEYYRMESVPVYLSAGCLAVFFGAKQQTVYYPQLIFRRPQKEISATTHR